MFKICKCLSCKVMLIFFISLFVLSCKHTVALQTAYLQKPVDGARRINIEGTLGELGRVQLDGNTCKGFNLLGDPGGCTKMFFKPVEVKYKKIELTDQTGKGRKVYQMIGDFPPPTQSSYKYYLVVPKSKRETYRFVVEDGNNIKVITLEPR